jgi:Uma2 family endonuclease
MVPEAVALVSVEEFWHLSHRLDKAELVGGQVVEVVLPGVRHGFIVATITSLLYKHVHDHSLGLALAETGFILSHDPPTVRGPDAAVVLAARIAAPVPVRFFPGAPDLAVEVLSPDDRPGEVAPKVADYLRAGTLAVWVVDPESRSVTVHTRAGATRYAANETLDGAPVLPDLHLPLTTLLGDL